MINTLGKGELVALLSLVYKVCALRRRLSALLLGVIGRLCSVLVAFPGHLYDFSM